MTAAPRLDSDVAPMALDEAVRRFLRRDVFEPAIRLAYGPTLGALAGELVPSQATFALVMVEARLITFRSLGSVVCRFRQAM
jgi:hypothetical protein